MITKPELRTSSGLVSLWVKPQTTKQYHPLVNTVFWVGNKLWGSSMLGYHLVNIFLHIVSALLLSKILRQLEIAGAWLVAVMLAQQAERFSGTTSPRILRSVAEGGTPSNISLTKPVRPRAAVGSWPQNAETPHSHN